MGKTMLLYTPIELTNENWREAYDQNWKSINDCDQKAKADGKLVGRFLDFPYADGKAIYQIVKENKQSVVIVVCTGIGDDWVLPFLGEKATVKKSYAIDHLTRRDRLDELFSRNKA
jgi:hypothetical protein